MRNFKNLEIWKLGYKLTNDIYALTSQFPKVEQYGLTSQMRRCAVSIPSNIAEGCSRFSKKELRRYIEIAIGSSFELETQLLIANQQNMITNNVNSTLEELNHLQRMMNSFRTSLK